MYLMSRLPALVLSKFGPSFDDQLHPERSKRSFLSENFEARGEQCGKVALLELRLIYAESKRAGGRDPRAAEMPEAYCYSVRRSNIGRSHPNLISGNLIANWKLD